LSWNKQDVGVVISKSRLGKRPISELTQTSAIKVTGREETVDGAKETEFHLYAQGATKKYPEKRRK